jgi:DNA-binding winged helix-turn-helix (wHTH) protein
MRPDVQEQYLGEQATTIRLLLVDCNRLAEVSEWGLYELLLTTILEATGDYPDLHALYDELHTARRDVIVSQNAMLARRSVELALRRICHERRIALCLILDEFDASYRQLSSPALANLRALRDTNKYRLSYVLVMREHPGRLRATSECEGFYELFARCVLGLSPYREADARRMIEQLQMRKTIDLVPPLHTTILHLSGGHPGLIATLVDALVQSPPEELDQHDEDWLEWAMAQAAVCEECQRIWDGLADDEHLALSRLVQGVDGNKDVQRILQLKGVIRTRDSSYDIFSPVLDAFIRRQATPVQHRLYIDERAGLVWLGERMIDNVTANEFKLLVFFYNNLGAVCSRDDILMYLYPEDMNDLSVGAQDNRVDTLVKRVREKIEPVPGKPRYLLTVRGRGYKLVDEDAHRAIPEHG